MSTVLSVATTTILSVDDMITALKAAGLPHDVVAGVELLYTPCTIRKVVESGDAAELKSLIHNVGDKRAAKIIDTLKGRIPAPMSKPVPDLRKPDVEMYKVPNFNLTYRDGRAVLTKDKLTHEGKVVMDGNEIVKDVASKRFGPALQMLQKVADKKHNVVFTTTTPVQEDKKDPAPSYAMEHYWKNVCKMGIKIGEGQKAMPLIMGTNAKMKCQIHWADERYIARVKEWVACGANLTTAQNIAKIEAYFGLLLPYTHPLLNGVLNPKMEVITPEWNNVHSGKNVLIDPDGTMTNKDEFAVNEFDGMCFVEITDELKCKLGMNRSELRQLNRAIAKFNGGTLRGPWHKGIIVVGFHIHEYLHAIGVHSINGKNIDDIAIFGDKSVFKASIGEGCLYEKFEDFADNFISKQHRFGVLLENHGIKHTFLPAQQLQAAHGADKQFIENGAAEEVAYLNAAQADAKIAAIRYAPRTIARIAQVDPEIMSTWFANELANNGYQKEYSSALSGRTHGNSVSGFGIKDPIAYCEWVAYKEGVRSELPTGMLNAYEIYAPTAGFTGRAVASRNPVIANYGLHTVEVIDNMGELDEFFDEGFDYIVCGIHDDLCKLLRMDHDGDKIRLTNAEWFCDAVESIPTEGIFAEWENFGPVVKAVPTRENEIEFFGTCTATPTLGLNVDTCGKMISNGVVTTNNHEMIMDYLMNKGTDVKQGADGSRVSGHAGEIWNEMQKLNKNSKYSIAQAHGKGLKGRVITSDKVWTEYGDNNLDIIAKAVKNNAANKLTFVGDFDVERVLINGMSTIKGLVGGGTKEKEYKDAGLFNTLVQRNAKEWDEIDEEIRKAGWAEYQAWKKAEAIKEMTELAEAQGKSLDDVYDALTTYVFVTLRKSWFGQNTSDSKRKWLTVLARTYIEWFGDKMEEVFAENEKIGVLPAVSEGVDLDEEVFGE